MQALINQRFHLATNHQLIALINVDDLDAFRALLQQKLAHPENEINQNAPGLRLYLLSKAVSVGALKIAKFLIDNGADMNLVNGAGSLVDKAMMYGHREIAGLLFAEGAEFNEAHWMYIEEKRAEAQAAFAAGMAPGGGAAAPPLHAAPLPAAGAGGAGAAAAAAAAAPGPMPSLAELEAEETTETADGTKVIVWTCPVCWGAKKLKTVLNCGHVICTECSTKIADNLCPSCRTPITSKQRVYIGGKGSNTRRNNRLNRNNRRNSRYSRRS